MRFENESGYYQRRLVAHRRVEVIVVVSPTREVGACEMCGEASDEVLHSKLFRPGVLRVGGRGDLPVLCAECRELASRGVCLFEVEALDDEPKVTGRYAVMARDAAERLGVPVHMAALGWALIDRGSAERCGLFGKEKA